MLKSRLPKIVAGLAPAVREAAGTGADMIVQDAKGRVHVRSGDLRDAIHADEQPEGIYVLAGDTDTWHGHLEEHGTSHSAPHPFLVPAFEENADTIVKLVAGAVRRL